MYDSTPPHRRSEPRPGAPPLAVSVAFAAGFVLLTTVALAVLTQPLLLVAFAAGVGSALLLRFARRTRTREPTRRSGEPTSREKPPA